MRPWREVCVPHKDVLENTFQQAEFAADITAVQKRRAAREYQNPADFYARTVITEGTRLLLTQVAKRLNGQGGEPVVQLQTGFGGGKTHTMLAVYHLATRDVPLKELAGLPDLLDRAGLLDVPRANAAVLDGNAHAPGQPWAYGPTKVRTLWGELAYQLGKEEGLALVAEADASGTSPGKDVLRELLARFSPCVVLVDELVAYIRQFPDGQALSGGTYESNLSFVQALTEAAKLVPTAMVLASLPESEKEAGGARGLAVLRVLEKLFGRIQAVWKPVATEEAFEIVRRRLFQPIADPAARDEVCRAFAKLYVAEGKRVPSETHEARYLDRLLLAYPIHPEVFDRLYEDWTTLETFQRTRGVLKLMARVIHRLWKDANQDLMILPGSVPLYDPDSRNELVYYLPVGWDAVLERDIDGDRAETTALDTREPRFGALHAARRVARAVFLGSAPASGGTHKGIRGVDRARMLLGCLQPGQSFSVYSDALNRLTDRLHYLNSSGDKAQETTRFWFDTRANLRREMEERKGRFADGSEVTAKIAEAMKRHVAGSGLFEGTHVFTPHGDVPDDGALRLVVLPLDKTYSKQDSAPAEQAALEGMKNNGTRPRYRGNRLVFVAADPAVLVRLKDVVRTALAWGSIVRDIEKGQLNIDVLQHDLAKDALRAAEANIAGAARECFKWLLCPLMASPSDKEPAIEVQAMNPRGGTFASELDRVCTENELVVVTWAALHLRSKLRDLYWKDGVVAVRAAQVWEDMLRHPFLPRLKNRGVLEQTIVSGAANRDLFGTALGQSGEDFEGFKLGSAAGVRLDDTLLLIEPAAAAAYEARKKAEAEAAAARAAGEARGTRETNVAPAGLSGTGPGTISTKAPGGPAPEQMGLDFKAGAPKARAFFGSVDVNASTAKMKLVQIAEEVIALLSADPGATVRVTVEVQAEIPGGVSDTTKRAVSENAAALGFKSKVWE